MDMGETTASEDSHTKIFVRSYVIGAAKTIPTKCFEYGKIVDFFQNRNIFLITYSKRSDAVRAINELNKFQKTRAEMARVQPMKCVQQNTHNNNNNNNVKMQTISNRNDDYGLNQYFDNFTIKLLKDIISECNLCSKMTSNKCSTCYEHYCSLKCQTLDWPKHKSNCKPVPILLKTKINDSISVHSTNTAHIQQNVFNESACEESDRNANVTNFNKKADMNCHNNYNNNNIMKGKEHRQFQCQKQNHNNNFRRNNFNSNNKQDNKTNDIKDKENITNDNMSNSNSIIKEPSSEQQHITNHSKNNLLEIINDNNIKSIIPLANSVVAITNACTSTIVYCRSLQEDHKVGYAKIVAEVFRYSLTAKPLQQLPQRNETILAKYEDAYYRAIVLKTEKNLVQVFFIDFGNIECVKLEDLKEIDSDIKNHSQYICRADLYEIPQHLTPAQIDICVNYLQSIVDEPLQILYTGELSRVKFKIIKNGQYVHDNILKLINKADKETATTTSFSPEKTATTETTTIANNIDNQSTITEYFMKDIKYKELKASNFELIILDTSNILENGTFHAVLPQDIESLIEINSILTDYGEENKTSYRPKEFDELCVAKYMANGQWYRAVFNKYFKKDNKFEVIFIDYGNICLVDAANIRSLNSSLLFPCLTVTCCIKDIPRNAQTKDILMCLNAIMKVDKTIIVEKASIIRDEDTIIHELIVPEIANILFNNKL